jgi:hypothetical protein
MATRVRSLGLTKKRSLTSARVARGVLGFRGALGRPGLSSDTQPTRLSLLNIMPWGRSLPLG